MKLAAIVKSFSLGAVLLALPAIASADTYQCSIREVRYFPERVHVRCHNPMSYGGFQIEYFAIPTSDWMTSLALVTIGARGLKDMRFNVDYEHVDASWFGCQWHDCREILSFRIRDWS